MIDVNNLRHARRATFIAALTLLAAVPAALAAEAPPAPPASDAGDTGEPLNDNRSWRVAENTVYLDPGHPSRILLPVIPPQTH